MRKTLVCLIMTCLLASSLPVSSADGTEDIPTVVTGTNNHTILVAALTYVDLVSALQGDGPFTVFAPTDQAFQAAEIDLDDYQTQEQKDKLKQILLFHVFNGSVSSSDVTDGMMPEMMNGDKVAFTNNGTNITIGGANVTDANIAASNGIVHVIDKVLMPPTDIPTTASDTGIHNTLVSAVQNANLLGTLSGEGPFTIFAPTDQAFDELNVNLSNLSETELSNILQYHVVGSEVLASEVTDCMFADAENTQPLSFTVSESGVMVNDANVIKPNVISSNGIIHVIDKVLMPTDTPRDIPRTAQCTGEHNSLVAAIVQAELLTTLQEDGPFTVFAPTDQAFEEAGFNLSSYNTPEGKAELADILQYHVLDSEVPSSAVTDCLSVNAINALPLSFTDDNGVMVNDANVVTADVATSNGVIHVIDKVLMPTATPTDIVRTAQCTGLNTLVDAVIQADLLTTLQGDGPFTLFAPTDQAFEEAGVNLSALNTEEGKVKLNDILLHHVFISDSIWASQIEDGQVVSMANGDNITLSKADGKIMIGDSTVTGADELVSNGIIHIVDKVIMPPSDEVNDASDETEGASDDDSSNFIWITLVVLLILGGGAGAVLFIRSKGAAATLAKDFSAGGLMNQLQPVEETAYTTQANQQVATQAASQPQAVQSVEVVQQPVVAEPTVLRQWTDEAGYTWRAMDDGKTYWWTGSDWQIYG